MFPCAPSSSPCLQRPYWSSEIVAAKIFIPFVAQCVVKQSFLTGSISATVLFLFLLSLFIPLSFSRWQEQCGQCRQHGQQSQCWQWTEHWGKLSTQWTQSVTFCCPGHHQGGLQSHTSNVGWTRKKKKPGDFMILSACPLIFIRELKLWENCGEICSTD